MSFEVKDYRTINTLSELNTEALDDKKAEKLAEVKVAKLLTLLFEIKAEVIMNTNIRRKSGFKMRRGAYQKIGLRAKKDKCNVTTVNESTGAGEHRDTN